MPGTFTIDFFHRTRSYVASDITPPRSGDLWGETHAHLAFCVARTFLNLDREDQIEAARQFDAWLKNRFAEFPVQEEGTPGPLIPCARFVSAYDGEAGSYVRSSYGFGLNARGLDYYGPMATAVLLRRMFLDPNRPDHLLHPIHALCEFVLNHPIEEAGHVELVRSYVDEALRLLPTVVPRDTPSLVETGQIEEKRVGHWKKPVLAGLVALGFGIAWLQMKSVPPPVVPASVVTAPVRIQPTQEIPPPPSEAPLPSEPVATVNAPTIPESPPSSPVIPAGAPSPITQPVPPPVSKSLAKTLPVQPPAPVQPSSPVPTPAPLPTPVPVPERLVAGKDGAPMALVPAGEFVMGTDSPGEDPPHRVFLEAYYMDRFEVTNARYLKFVEGARHRTPQHYIDPLYDLWIGANMPPAVADRPVVNVDWYDAAAYCKWAGKRLPTEAEWEKAARGTDGRIYPWGNEPPTAARLNFEQKWAGSETLRPVGSFGAGSSPYGVHDLAGNVAEWVSDWYDAGYYRVAPERDPRGPAAGSAKILRGGSWTNHAATVRATARHADDPEGRNGDIGFRCAQDYKN